MMLVMSTITSQAAIVYVSPGSYEYTGNKYITIKTGEKITLNHQDDSGFWNYYIYCSPTYGFFEHTSSDSHAMIIRANEVSYRKDFDGNSIGASTECDIIGVTPGTSTIQYTIGCISRYSIGGKRSNVYVRIIYHVTVTASNSTKLSIELTDDPGKRVPRGTSVTLKTSDPDATIYYSTGNGWQKGGNGSTNVNIQYNLSAFAVKSDCIGSDILQKSFSTIEPGDFHAVLPSGADVHFKYVDGNNKTCELYYVPQTAKGEFIIPKAVNGYSIVSIGNRAFLDCTELTAVTIPEATTTIRQYAFQGCKGLASVTISESVAEIESHAFNGCTGLKSISIPSSVKTIGLGAFEYSGLVSLNLDEGVKEIDICAFQDCYNMENIVLPSSLEKIGYAAFRGCINLKSVKSYIEEPFPLNDTAFDTDTLPGTSINVRGAHWTWTSATLYVPKGCKEKYESTSGWWLFQNIVEMNDDPEPTLQGDVNGDGTVNGTDLVALASIILGKQAETAAADVNGDGKVNGTDIVALCNIILGRAASPERRVKAQQSTANTVFTAQTEEGVEMTFMVLDETAKTCQVGSNTPDNYKGTSTDPNAIDWRTIGEITIPEEVNGYTVVGIGLGAFSMCFDITKINLPPPLRFIEADAFIDCGIKDMVLPDNVESIGSHAFHESRIESIRIPAKVTTIEDGAFSCCDQLKTITSFIKEPFDLSEEPSAKSGWTIFGGCNLSGITLYVPYGTKAKYQQKKVWKDFPNIVEMEQEGPDVPISNEAHLSIQPFDIKAGETKTMTINLNNPNDELTLVQFDLHLPQGLSIKTAGGDLDIDMGERTNWRKHTLDANEVDGGTYRFLLYSSSNALISGTSGGIITVTLKADNSFNGGVITIDNALLVSPEQKETKPSAYEYTIGTVTPPTPNIASLSIEPFNIKAGETKTMTINLNNPNDELTLVQFDLHLPQGLSIKTAGGDLDIDMCERTNWRKHTLDANKVDGDTYRFLLYSSSNALISGTSGGIITVTLKADNTFNGGIITIDNALLVSPEQKETKPAAYVYTIGEVTPPCPDITSLSVEPFNIRPGETKTMTINLDNPNDELTLVQFDLHLPQGLSIGTAGGDLDIDMGERTNWRKHTLDANKVDGNTYRFLLYSSSNALISGTSGGIITVTLKADNSFNGGVITIDNALLVSPEQKETKPSAYEYNISLSMGIDNIAAETAPQRIFNLSGLQLKEPQKGINIINGRKVFVK